MSTNKMSDEELDALFQRAVDNVDPPFDPEAWQAMEQKLDQAQVRRPWFRRLLPLLLLLLLPLLLVLMSRRNKPLQPLDESAPAAADHPSQLQPATLPKTLAEANAAAEGRAGGAVNDLSGKAKAAAAEAPPAAGEGTAAVAGAEKVKSYINNTKPMPALAAPGKRTEEELLLSRAVAIDFGEQTQPRLTALSVAIIDSVNPEVAAPELAAATASPDSSARKKPSPFARSLRIALVGAPDITTVRFKNPDAVSTNAGLVLGVPLTRRLSLVAGVVWAEKVYGASPEDYNPGTDYWQGKKMPDAIDANCKVLDIPLNLEYQLLQRPNFTLALQAGLSSYLMLDEKYTYIYGSGYGSYEKVWEVQNQNKHWFKVQNLSISYIYHLSPSLFVGAEPFVKIPLTDIGAGNVKLTSAGVFLTAGYNLPLRK